MEQGALQQPTAPKPTLFLHIGSEKTGTSSLHWFLANNTEQLDREGFTYLTGEKPYYSRHSRAHSPIVASFFPQPPDFIAPSEHVASEPLLSQLQNDLLLENRNVILSSEHFSSRLRSAAALKKLAAALSPFHVHVVFYMRPQYELYLSAYSTAIINGRREPLGDGQVRVDDAYFNYSVLLSPWAQVFGKQNIVVRDYKNLLHGDICADFAQLVGIRDFSKFHQVPRKNQSLTTDGTEVIRKLNHVLPGHGESGYLAYFASIQLRWLVNSFVRLFHRPAPAPNLHLKQKIESIFARSNQELSETYSDHVESKKSRQNPTSLNVAAVSDRRHSPSPQPQL